MPSSRRAFLQELSAAAALGVIGRVPSKLLWGTAPPTELVPEWDEALLRVLALAAVDAARAAGATFADVRVTAGRSIVVSCRAQYRQGGASEMAWPDLTIQTVCGVRAIVDGGVGFASGADLTADAVRAVAQQAVTRARSNRPRRPRAVVLAPVPHPDQGTWATPIAQDPFRVPLGEQADLAFAALAEAGRVRGVDSAAVELRWNRNVRVFASSEGALLVQRMAVAVPSAGAGVRQTPTSSGAFEDVPVLRGGPYGYEALTRVDLPAALRQAAERAVAEARGPRPRPVEAGRYDLVFSAPAVAALLTATIATALNLERALGYQANDPFGGTSFAAPPAAILGRYQVASPLLTLRADRTRPQGAATVGWDDEGVRAGRHTLVRNGIIVDYLTNRRTAVELADWYTSRGEPVGSRGCVSGAGQRLPRVALPNLAMEPGQHKLAVEDLIADTKRGFYLEGILSGGSDQQVLNTQFSVDTAQAREIRNGRLGGRIQGLAFQFTTPVFWQRMDAIGGTDSSVETLQSTGYSVDRPTSMPYASVSAVPARVRGMTVLSTGVSA